jgi:FkbM family methyltransferase
VTVHDVHIEGFPPFKIGLDTNFYADWVLFSYLSANKTPEPEVVDLIRRVVSPGDVVIDGGANVGFYSMLMAGVVGEAGRVIAFEPAPPNIERFRQNREVNRFGNVALYTDALWSEAATLDFWVGKDSGQSALWSSVDSVEKIQVRALPLDSIAPTLAAGVKFMKLDVEGAEEWVLQGACDLLGGGYPKFVVCELNTTALTQLDCCQDSLRSYMFHWNYQIFLLREDGGLPALVPERTVIRPKKQNCNVLFARLSDVQTAWPEANV